jgi:hypothetical protein
LDTALVRVVWVEFVLLILHHHHPTSPPNHCPQSYSLRRQIALFRISIPKLVNLSSLVCKRDQSTNPFSSQPHHNSFFPSFGLHFVSCSITFGEHHQRYSPKLDSTTKCNLKTFTSIFNISSIITTVSVFTSNKVATSN